MDRKRLQETREWVRKELASSAEFWLKYGMDKEHGGVYTCIDRTGRLFSTDKSVWMQGRCGWTYAYLCTVYGTRPEWLEASKSCLDFMEKHCINREADGRMYFTVTGDGKPLRQRRYCFSEGFYALANAEYYAVTGDRECLERARRAYELIYQLNNGLIKDPAGMGPKTIPETRSGRALADPMIYLNITSVMRRCDPEHREVYDARAKQCVETIFRYHHKPELKCTLETVGMNGEFWSDISAGRFVNPGHDIECSWFLMEEAKYEDDPELRAKAMEVFDMAIERGWDKEYGGIFYFLDRKGAPRVELEWDQKLWWVHIESTIAMIKGYQLTGSKECLEWFGKLHEYTWAHFKDTEHPEWFGYLNRRGEVLLPLKGGKWKGCFHVPRGLFQCWQILEQCK